MAPIRENEPLRLHTNYKIGGPARYFIFAQSEEDLREAREFASSRKIPVFILGGGTNVLVSDDGFDGLVVKAAKMGIVRTGNRVCAGAGEQMSDVLEFCAKEGLSGLEWAGGLPGSVGGAVRGNAGAFAGEMKDSLARIKSICFSSGRSIDRDAAECAFRYRDSIFKNDAAQEVIWEAVFDLSPADAYSVAAKIGERIAFRKARHPMEYPSAGSTFKNIPVASFATFPEGAPVKEDPFPVVPVGYLLEQCALKGACEGGACMSEKHPNFIVNKEGASALQIRALIARAKKEVKKKFGVRIEEEIQYLGNFHE